MESIYMNVQRINTDRKVEGFRGQRSAGAYLYSFYLDRPVQHREVELVEIPVSSEIKRLLENEMPRQREKPFGNAIVHKSTAHSLLLFEKFFPFHGFERKAYLRFFKSKNRNVRRKGLGVKLAAAIAGHLVQKHPDFVIKPSARLTAEGKKFLEKIGVPLTRPIKLETLLGLFERRG